VSDSGELIIERDWNLCAGYEDDPEANERVFPAPNTVMTGDIGVVESDGFIRLAGRKGNVIITRGGRKISLESIEERVALVEGVLASIVFPSARPSELAGVIWLESNDRATRLQVVDSLMTLNRGEIYQTPVTEIVFAAKPLSETTELLTRNLKPNRGAVREHFSSSLQTLGNARDADML